MNKLESAPAVSTFNRRRVLQGLGLAGAALALPGALAQSTAPSDADVLNFALNLEYLDTEYYLRAVFGRGLSAADAGASAGPVNGLGPVAFSTPEVGQFAREVALDEEAQVRFLRSQLGAAAVSRPRIDLIAGFTAAARGAGLVGPTETFNPFADELTFLLGVFLFEEVAVTAYKGSARLLSDRNNLENAAGILAVEAYHAGAARTLLFAAGDTARNRANAISNARDALDGPQQDLDQELVLGGRINLVPADANSVAFSRTPQQVLRIAYVTPEAGRTGGGFFPDGINHPRADLRTT